MYGAEAALKQAHVQLGELMRHEHCPLSVAQRCSGVPAPAPLFPALLNRLRAQLQWPGEGPHRKTEGALPQA